MSEPELFILSERAMKRVVDQISDDQWSMKLPGWFHRGPSQKDLTLREIINYHAYDDAWVPDVLAGSTIADVGDKHDGDLLGADPKGNFSALADQAIAAVERLKDLDQAAHLTYGVYPAREYLSHITYFRGLRAYDIARLIGTDTKLPVTLVQGLWEVLSPNAEQWRALGVFGAAVSVPQTAPLQDRLIGLTGRKPH